MKKNKFISSMIFMLAMCGAAFAADAPAPVRRVSVFSTSTDWSSITGMQLNEYRGEFKVDTKLVGRGMVLYYLDGFPCYGLGDGVRIWADRRGTDDTLRIVCVTPPISVNFAYRYADRDDREVRTTGMITCPVKSDGRELKIDMSYCTRGKDWADY